MRMLADNPSIEFLRREAKDLLASMRESDTNVTLADAQRALADMYGFRAWSELKAEVERRRDAPPEAPVGLADAVAEAFGLGEVKRPMTALRYEYMGRRWHLETERGSFMLSPVFDWIDDHQAGIALDLQERARAQGVLSPEPVRTPDGGLVRRVLDQSWRVDQWMDLGPTPVPPVHSSVARRVGEVLATIHEVAPRTDRRIEGPWVGTADRPTAAHWDALLQRARGANVPWVDRLAALSPVVAELSEVATEAPQEQVVITNRDVVIDAVRFGPGGDLVVMHWDYAGPMLPEWELASTLLHWGLYDSGTIGAARALLEGYAGRAGHAPELSLGSFTTAITGWLTWTLHRAWEASGPQPEEKGEFADRSVREVLEDPLTVGRIQSLITALESVVS